MKSYWHLFRQMLWALLYGIPAGCVIGGLLLGCIASLLILASLAHNFDLGGLSELHTVPSVIAFFAFLAGLVCIPCGLLFGAPVGAWLFQKSWAKPWTAAVAGCVPAVFSWLWSLSVTSAIFPIVFGLPVALSTYWFARGRIERRSESH